MQRFGTASVPTHAIGLALLKSEWQKAISLILRKRHGEHPDVVAARDAWLVDGDLDRALDLMPKRVIAERCILESYKKQGGDTRNAMGALSTVNNLNFSFLNCITMPTLHFVGTDSSESSPDVHPCISVICMECYRFRENLQVRR